MICQIKVKNIKKGQVAEGIGVSPVVVDAKKC